jgi:geranylgeranyl pyrophosphate synthase
MDNARLRRGKPSCHRKYGEGQAVLVGDALLTLAFDWLSASTSLGTESRARRSRVEGLSRNGVTHTLDIIHLLGRAGGTAGLIGGQALDLDLLRRPGVPSAASLRGIAQRKTAALIHASVLAGAMAAGAGAAERRHLGRYGRAIGLAFQLLDDVRDGEGLARALGRERARRTAQRLIRRAQAAIAPLRPRGRLLRELAEWLATT